jgi:antitoxin (DNA-binding transcriptional repressor) of toxin-antitoxin stability system
MKTTTIGAMRSNCTKVLKWVSAGQEVQVTRRGKVVARVVPPARKSQKANWSLSAALNRPDFSWTLAAKESAAILADSR